MTEPLADLAGRTLDRFATPEAVSHSDVIVRVAKGVAAVLDNYELDVADPVVARTIMAVDELAVMFAKAGGPTDDPAARVAYYTWAVMGLAFEAASRHRTPP